MSDRLQSRAMYLHEPHLGMIRTRKWINTQGKRGFKISIAFPVVSSQPFSSANKRKSKRSECDGMCNDKLPYRKAFFIDSEWV